MKNKLTKVLLATVLAIFGTVGLVAPSFATANGMNCNDSLKKQIGETAYASVCGNDDGDADDGGISDTIVGILKAIIGITGLIAVIFVVIGAIGYLTSAGDPGKIKKAKDTILYALIGLIIAGLAFAITNAVAGTVNESTNATETSKSK